MKESEYTNLRVISTLEDKAPFIDSKLQRRMAAEILTIDALYNLIPQRI